MADHSQPGGGDDPWDLGPASGPGALSGVYSGQDPQADVADEHPFDRAEGQRYRDPQLIGWGGMGRVSTVTDTRLRREVALKEVTLEGPQGGSLERRLAQEAWISARLDHPGIVAVHDAGRAPDGRLFFTMRLIRGRSLRSAVEARDLSEGALLRHFLAACQAMGYAHSEGVLHRDLKPANVMLGEYGDTQLVDWGLACSVEAAEGSATGEAVPHQLAARTVAGSVIGTPAYMSPEQARGAPADRRSDVWSLGAIAFEIVVGRPLFGPDLEGTAVLERLVRGEVDPGAADDARRAAERSPELWAIVEHALALAPADRYPDARALADDVAAWLDGRLVDAYDYSPLDMARRFVRAFRLPLAVAAAAFISVALVGWLSYSATLDERDRARLAEREASQARRAAELSQATMLVQRAQDAADKGARAEAELLAAHALRIRESPEARGVLARFGVTPPPTYAWGAALPECKDSSLSPDADRLVCLEPDGTSMWEVPGARPMGSADVTEPPPALEPLWLTPRAFNVAAFAGPDALLVWPEDTALEVGATRLLHAGTGALMGEACDPMSPDHAVTAAGVTLSRVLRELAWRDQRTSSCRVVPLAINGVLAISADGRLGLAHSQPEEVPLLVELASGSSHALPKPFPPLAESSMSVALDAAGSRAAFGGTEGSLAVMSLPDGAVLWRSAVTDRALSVVAWSPDGAWLATADERGWVALHSAAGTVHWHLPRVEAREVRWRRTAHGLQLVTLGAELVAYDLPDEAVAGTYRTEIGISHVGLDVSGRRLALPDGSGSATVFDVERGVVLQRTDSPGGGVAKAAVFDTVSDQLWVSRMASRSALALGSDGQQAIGDAGPFKRLAPIAGGGVLAATYGSAVVAIQAGAEPGERLEHRAPGGALRDLEAGHGGEVAAILSVDGGVELWRAHAGGETRGVVAPLVREPSALVLGVDAAGTLVATASRDELRVFRTADLVQVMLARVPSAPIEELALSADGALVAVGLRSGVAQIYRVLDGQLLATLAGHRERVSGLAFAPDGRWLVTVSWDSTALRWDLRGLTRGAEALVAEVEARWGLGVGHATGVDLR